MRSVHGLFHRCLQLFGAYAAFILASIPVGFLGSAVVTWALILWVVVVILDLVWYFRRRRDRREDAITFRTI